MMEEMIEDRHQYSMALQMLEEHLASGQTLLTELNSLSTGHTAGHARTLTHRAQVRKYAFTFH